MVLGDSKSKARFGARARYGFTLTEMAIVLGVIGAILGGIWEAMANASQAQKATRAEAQIVSIVHSIRTLYATRGQFTQSVGTDQTSNFMKLGFFTPDMVGAGQAVPTSPYGQPVNVYAPMVSSPSNIFRVSYNNVTASQCNAITSAIISGQLATSSDPINLITGGTNIINLMQPYLNPDGVLGVINPDGIAAACAVTLAGSSYTSVAFDFQL